MDKYPRKKNRHGAIRRTHELHDICRYFYIMFERTNIDIYLDYISLYIANRLVPHFITINKMYNEYKKK